MMLYVFLSWFIHLQNKKYIFAQIISELNGYKSIIKTKTCCIALHQPGVEAGDCREWFDRLTYTL